MDDEQFDQQSLAIQRRAASYGIVTHQRGLDIIDTTGWVIFGEIYVCIFPDNAQVVRKQPRVMVPVHQVVSISLEGDDS